MNMDEWTLAFPWAFLVLPALVVVAIVRGRRKREVSVVPYAAMWLPQGKTRPMPSWKSVLMYLGATSIVFALARPQIVREEAPTERQGYDIMLCIDLSGSMLAEDAFRNGQRINRLQAVLPVIQDFVRKRPDDRIGVVVFAGRAYTLANLTMQHEWLERQIGRLSVEMLEDGTAIGDGLGVALSRLENSLRLEEEKRAGAFIVLMTDGSNNSGSLLPLQAAELIARRGIPVFTIAVGQIGIVPFPVFDRFGRRVGYENVVSDIDLEVLEKIAKLTGGRAFHVDNAAVTDKVFHEINKATPVRIESEKFRITKEYFHHFAAGGFFLVLLAALFDGRSATLLTPSGIRRA